MTWTWPLPLDAILCAKVPPGGLDAFELESTMQISHGRNRRQFKCIHTYGTRDGSLDEIFK